MIGFTFLPPLIHNKTIPCTVAPLISAHPSGPGELDCMWRVIGEHSPKQLITSYGLDFYWTAKTQHPLEFDKSSESHNSTKGLFVYIIIHCYFVANGRSPTLKAWLIIWLSSFHWDVPVPSIECLFWIFFNWIRIDILAHVDRVHARACICFPWCTNPIHPITTDSS